MATLTLLHSPVRGEGRSQELENAASVYLGRAGIFNTGDPSSAPQHARLVTDGDGDAVVMDLGSTNGTIVNGVRVQRAHLADRDQVLIGDCLYEVRTTFPRRCPTCRAEVKRDRVLLGNPRIREWPYHFLGYSCPSCHCVFVPGPRGGGRVEIAGALVLRTLDRLKRAAELGEEDEWRRVEPMTLLGVPEIRTLLVSSDKLQP